MTDRIHLGLGFLPRLMVGAAGLLVSVVARLGMPVMDRLPAIVFVRYGLRHDFNHSLSADDANLEGANAWLVEDHGAENGNLMARAPGSTTWLYDEDRRRFDRIPQSGAPE